MPEAPIEGLEVVERLHFSDHRGWLSRIVGLPGNSGPVQPNSIHQVNVTHTSLAGTVRGLHYQQSHVPEVKLLTCLRGSIYDVVLDLRRSSATFGQWRSFVLSSDDSFSLVIPSGCAHGLQTLVDDVLLLYVHTAPYDPVSENGVHPLDADLAIPWPQEVMAMSRRDRELQTWFEFMEGRP